LQGTKSLSCPALLSCPVLPCYFTGQGKNKNLALPCNRAGQGTSTGQVCPALWTSLGPIKHLIIYMNNNQIKMASYFNKDKETDWAIFGGMYGDVVWNKFNVYIINLQKLFTI
jgi:hypothetical protein